MNENHQKKEHQCKRRREERKRKRKRRVNCTLSPAPITFIKPD
uniref:Uncharacterized protein n=1 Tax=Nelumbo nucifera TaxID=4432 RepID=A0A822Y8V6_NELNU|nr:TPA_asm: hypothetical protein HUJ06_027496 [Nelumbo nucifera]